MPGASPVFGSAARRLSLLDCRIDAAGTGVGIDAISAHVAAVRTRVIGGTECWDSLLPTAFEAVRLHASTFQASQVSLTGGASPLINSGPWSTGGAGLRVTGASIAVLTDSILVGGEGFSGAGGSGIVNLTTTPVEIARSTLIAGQGAPPGQPSVGPVVTNQSLLGIVRPLPFQIGQAAGLEITSLPGTPLILLASGELQLLQHPALAQPLWLATQPDPLVVAFRTADASGRTPFSVTVPNVAALRGTSLWLQGLGAASALQLTPPVGGVVF